MAFFTLFQSLALILALITIPSFSASAYRNPTAFEFRSNPKTLAARLNLDNNNDPQSSNNCWDSLIQLQSCSGEAIMFFLNGETVLSDGFCEAIRVIEHQCWSALLVSLGSTTQETDILKGYCDEEAAEESNHRRRSPPLPPEGDYRPNRAAAAVRFP